MPLLPAPPLLGFDEVYGLDIAGGLFGLGGARARIDLQRMNWVFACHFVSDPVMPGTMMLDALFQLLGFYAAASGYSGRGRAAGVKKVRFVGEVLPSAGSVEYEVAVSRASSMRQIVVGDGTGFVGGRVCIRAEGLAVVVVP